ncbi:MAG: DUF465 domain-containing protein [Alphaproteobacteria bacterium]|nr:DUF465 domain-containing protein [Alphaproteobacteria bacterium]
MPSHGFESAPLTRLEALKKKHALYKEQIREAQKSPAADFYLKQLKKQKLLVKEEIEGIRYGGRASA